MVVTAEQVAQKPFRPSGRDGKHSEAQVDHIDGAPLVKMPSMAHGRWDRHLT
jgi:hypothetical protein